MLPIGLYSGIVGKNCSDYDDLGYPRNERLLDGSLPVVALAWVSEKMHWQICHHQCHSNRTIAKQVSNFYQGAVVCPQPWSTVHCSRSVSNTLRSDHGQWYCKVCNCRVLFYCCIGLESYLQESCGFPEVASAVLQCQMVW